MPLTQPGRWGQGAFSTSHTISSANPDAKQLIDGARLDYAFTPFEDPVDLDPALDQTLEDILRNMPE